MNAGSNPQGVEIACRFTPLVSELVNRRSEISSETPKVGRALLKMNGDDENSTVVFLHGYASGKAGTTVISIASLTEATDKIRDHCIDNPNDKLLDVFSKIK